MYISQMRASRHIRTLKNKSMARSESYIDNVIRLISGTDIILPTPPKIDVVTAFLEFDGQILILRRSNSVKTMKEKWGAVSGYLENNDPLTQAIVEINEETGLDRSQILLVRSGDVLLAIDHENSNTVYNVYPYLFRSKSRNVRLSREHDRFEWISMHELWRYDTVPKLKEAYERVAGSLHTS
jgi:8-oxo-dGTP diphosphatase